VTLLALTRITSHVTPPLLSLTFISLSYIIIDFSDLETREYYAQRTEVILSNKTVRFDYNSLVPLAVPNGYVEIILGAIKRRSRIVKTWVKEW
jgi:hypothetical protein